jgi:DNA-binding transcriptional LysR family regulator
MDLDQVSAFLMISRLGGFTRASSSLHLSQPALSRRIQLLEQELGAPLFERVHSGVIITDAGRAFLPHAEALLASVRDGIEAVAAVRGTSQGTVTLALVGTLASAGLTDRLRCFRDAHPEIDLRLRTGLSTEVSALVRSGAAEFGLRYEPDPDPHLVSSTVYHEPMVPVCPPGHRLARAPRVEPAELADERWITFPSRPGGVLEPYQSALEHWRAACGLGTAEIIPIDSLTAQKRMVEAGFGLALLPASSVHDELRTGSLCMLPVAATSVTIPVALIRRRHAFHSGAAQALAAMFAAWPEQPLDRRRSPADV